MTCCSFLRYIIPKYSLSVYPLICRVNQCPSHSQPAAKAPSQLLLYTVQVKTPMPTMKCKCWMPDRWGYFYVQRRLWRICLQGDQKHRYQRRHGKMENILPDLWHGPPVMDPNRFKGICMEVGATSLFSTIHDAMSSDRMSDERQELTKLRVMVVMYTMMYSQSHFKFSLTTKWSDGVDGSSQIVNLRAWIRFRWTGRSIC